MQSFNKFHPFICPLAQSELPTHLMRTQVPPRCHEQQASSVPTDLLSDLHPHLAPSPLCSALHSALSSPYGHSPSPCLLAYLAPSHSLSSFFPLALSPSTKLLMTLYHSCPSQTQLEKWPFVWLKAVTVMEKPEALALNRPGFKIWRYKHLYFDLRFPFMCENDNYLIRSLSGLSKVTESANST